VYFNVLTRLVGREEGRSAYKIRQSLSISRGFWEDLQGSRLNLE